MIQLKKFSTYCIIDLYAEMTHLGMDLSAVMLLTVERLVDLLDVDGVTIEMKENSHLVLRAGSGIAKFSIGIKVPLSEKFSWGLPRIRVYSTLFKC
ncbi:MAG: hypothetical protein U5L01_07055 [Rheinheimera sp.]|nr:hypothetical protein [Rheinheimera sp.]